MSNYTLASFILAATAVASPLAFAAVATPSSQRHTTESQLTREQVVQETLTARRNGSLLPTGESASADFRTPVVNTASRAYVPFDAKLAWARGQLVPAGEAALPLNSQTSISNTTRDQVKRETRAARLNGTLQPAGEGANTHS